MNDLRTRARFAGLLYGLAAGAAPFAYFYVPDMLLVQGDALATVERVREHEGLLRAAIYSELSGAVLLLFATLALYRLFKDVDRNLALVMAAMMLVSVPISFVNALNNIAPIILLKNTAIASLLDPAAMAVQVNLFLRLHAYGLFVNQIFWGLWLFPIGMLIMRSGFLPRWLGIPLMVAGGGYVLNSLGTLLLPNSLRWMTNSLQILGVGELAFYYLLIRGVRGYAVDRVSALLVVLKFVIGMAGLALLMTRRIDAIQYAMFTLVTLAVVVALALRWRSQAETSAVAVEA